MKSHLKSEKVIHSCKEKFFKGVLRPNSKQWDAGRCQKLEIYLPVTIWAVVLGGQLSACLSFLQFLLNGVKSRSKDLQWNTATDFISLMGWSWILYPWVSGRSGVEFFVFSTVSFFYCKSLISSSGIKIKCSRIRFQVLWLLSTGTWGITPRMILEFTILSLEVVKIVRGRFHYGLILNILIQLGAVIRTWFLANSYTLGGANILLMSPEINGLTSTSKKSAWSCTKACVETV